MKQQKQNLQEQKQVSLEVVHANAAGIDIGSRSHWVAVGQHAQDVKEFGVYTEDHEAMCKWLHEKQVEHIAMESTGTYWQTLYSALILSGFEVILVNGKQTKNIRGKKTDIKDCQWIQKLHSIGLLSSSFLPDSTTEIIRTYSRQRLNLIEQASSCTKRMQKFLRLMNMRLDVAINDINGLTGTLILKAFAEGQTSGVELAKFRDPNCKKSEEEIAKALQYNGRLDYYFAFKQEQKTHQHLQTQIKEIDAELHKLLQKIINEDNNKKQHVVEVKKYKRKNKNGYKNIDVNDVAYKYFEGVDLMAIEGVNEATIMSIISEVGLDGLKKFNSAKQFTAWLRLAPNNKISGGKVLSHHTPKGSSRLKIALRNAANAIGQLKEGHLNEFFKKILFKKGRITAITATARKLAVIIWNMVVKNIPYNPPTPYLFLDEKRKLGIIKRIKKQIDKFDITNLDLGLMST